MQPQEGRRCSHLSNILAMLNTQINTPANSKMMTYAAKVIHHFFSYPRSIWLDQIHNKFASTYAGAMERRILGVPPGRA
jgi:hypothetical protein